VPEPESAPAREPLPSTESPAVASVIVAPLEEVAGVPQESESPSEELSAALEGDLSGPVPIPRDTGAIPRPEATESAPRLEEDVSEDTILDPRPTSSESDV